MHLGMYIACLFHWQAFSRSGDRIMRGNVANNFSLSFYHRPYEYIRHASCLFRMSCYLAGLSRVTETKQKISSLFILSCLRSCLFNKRGYRRCLSVWYFDYLAYMGGAVAANMETVFAHRHSNIFSGCLSLADPGA